MAKSVTQPDRIDGVIVEGLAIVSADGMIADHDGHQPDALLIEADQQFFHDRLRAADVLVHGRHSGEVGSQFAGRHRIVLTRRVAAATRDPENGSTVLWNPADATFAEAWSLVRRGGGHAAVIGGTDVFGLFLERGYDLFHLSRTGRTRLPGGRAVFPGVPERSPEALLAAHGLKPGATRVLDATAELTLTTWRP